MSSSVFDTTCTPTSVLKTLAKRLRKHPYGAALTSTEALEVMARTFGHDSWHQATHRPDGLAFMGALSSKAWRDRFYTHMEHCLEAGLGVHQGLESIAEAAQWTGDHALQSLCDHLAQHYVAHGDIRTRLEQLIQPHSRMESVVLRTGFSSEPLLTVRRARQVQS